MQKRKRETAVPIAMVGGEWFPEDIIIKILKRVAAKSLIRFKCVSKQWYSLITNPKFIRTHRDHHSKHNPSLLNYYVPNRHEYHLSILHPKSSTVEDVHIPTSPCDEKDHHNRYSFKIVASYNGLVCFEACYHKYGLWNPVTREFRYLENILPHGDSIPGMRMAKPFHALGYSSHIDDYKLVRIASFFTQTYRGEKERTQAGIFSWRNNSCRLLDVRLPDDYFGTDYERKDVCVMGQMYWKGRRRRNIVSNNYIEYIVGFDMVNENFRKIKLPDSIQNKTKNDDYIWMIAEFKESLAIFVYENKERHDFGNREFNVWVLKESGGDNFWIQMLTIEPFHRLSVPESTWRGGEILMKKHKTQTMKTLSGLYSYDTDSKETTRLLDIPFPIHEGSLGLYHYVESLVSVYGPQRR